MGETIHGGRGKVKAAAPAEFASQPACLCAEKRGLHMTADAKQFALDWVLKNRQSLSDWNQIIWHYAEPALREYKSAAWYVERLRAEGFDVEAGSGGMPTAFAPATAAARARSSAPMPNTMRCRAIARPPPPERCHARA